MMTELDLRIHHGPFPDHLLPAAYFDPDVHCWGVLRVPIPPKSPAMTFRVSTIETGREATCPMFTTTSNVSIYDPTRGKWTDAWTMPATSVAAAEGYRVATLYLRFFRTNAELVAEDTDTEPMAVQLWTEYHHRLQRSNDERLVQRVACITDYDRRLTEELYRHASQQWLYHARQLTSVSPTRPGLTRENEAIEATESHTERFNNTGLQYFWSRLSDYHEDVASSGEGDPAILAILQASLENVYTASWHMNQNQNTQT
jgi:hypothetical protein